MKRKIKKSFKYLILIIILFGLSSCSLVSEVIVKDELEDNSLELVDDSKDINSSLEVHFIDVGQGDSILIKEGTSSMLIDGGSDEYKEKLIDYLKDNNVDKLDCIIASHPHEDHIGTLDDIINTFEVNKVIMPKLVHTTQSFESLVEAIAKKDLKITKPNVYDKYDLGKANYTILGPASSEYELVNDYSIIVKLDYGERSFIFTGDSEEVSESELLNLGFDLKSDVLKVSHHGSSTSSSEKFLDKVMPKYAIIQVGKDNDYGFPHKWVLNKLRDRNIKVYRNDLHGNIKVVCNGDDLSIETEKPYVEDTYIETYIGNKNSLIFHRGSCEYLPAEHNRIYLNDKKEAIDKGFKPCGGCKP